jgi:uncharacterized protein YnzC (UPF0291/DUF896 family)
MSFIGARLKVGKVTVRTPQYPSEARYVESVRAGMKQLMDNVNYIFEQFEEITPEIMIDVLQPIFDESQVLVPQRTGALKQSGFLRVASGRTGNIWVEMGYADGGEPFYAAYVHEMVQIPHRPPTQAKFLEKPLNDHMLGIIDELALRYKSFAGL